MNKLKNYYNVLAVHDEISFNKKCLTTGGLEKTAEYYFMSGFKESEIIIQEYLGGLMVSEKTWEEYNSKISTGQLISEIQEGIIHFSESGSSGEENGMKSELINPENLRVVFESGEKFLVTVSEL